MEPENKERQSQYRHLEAPIPLAETIETVDVSERVDAQGGQYRDQEWMLRVAAG